MLRIFSSTKNLKENLGELKSRIFYRKYGSEKGAKNQNIQEAGLSDLWM